MENRRENIGDLTAKNMFWNYIGKFAEFGLAGLFFLLVGRKLGPKGYGSYNLIMTFVTSLVLFLSIGFETALVRFVPEYSAKGKDLEGYKLFKKLLVIRSGIFLLAALILLYFAGFIGSKLGEVEFVNLKYLISILLIGLGIRDIINAYYFSILNIKILSIIKIISQSAGLIVIAFLLYTMAPRLEYAFYCFTFGIFVFVGISLSRLKIIAEKYEFRSGEENTSLKKIIKFSVFTWVTSVFTYFLGGQVNVLLLGYLLKDPEKIGYYSSAIMIGYLPGVFISGMAGVFLPSLTRAMTSGGVDSFKKTLNGLSKVLIAVLVPVIVFLGAYPGRFITTLLGEKFFPSASLFRMYALFSLFNVLLLTHLTYNALYALRQEKKVLYVRIISGVLNVCLLFILIPEFGPLGAVIAISMSLFFQQVGEFFLIRRHVTGFYPSMLALKSVVASLVATGSVYYINLRGKIGLLVVCGVFVLVLIFLYKILRVFSFEDKKRIANIHPMAEVISKIL